MKTVQIFSIGFFTFTLFACSGGSSSSAVGSGTIYNGEQTVTVSGPFPTSPQSDTFPIRIVVNGNSVTLGETINNNTVSLASDGVSFTLPLSLTFWDAGLPCQRTLTYTGKIEGSTVSGTISGSGPCVDRIGGTTSLTNTGSFKATAS